MERRTFRRRKFSYYMKIMDEKGSQLIGYLAEIGEGGFKIDSQKSLPVGRDLVLRIDLPREISNKSCMLFKARTKWCQVDRYDANSFTIGFQIVEMSRGDMEIFKRMFEKYGAQNSREEPGSDTLWK